MTKLLIQDDLQKYPQFQAIHKKLFTERNIDMADNVAGFLKGQGTYFVVVGAGHMVNDDGIVSLLQKKGYNVERR